MDIYYNIQINILVRITLFIFGQVLFYLYVVCKCYYSVHDFPSPQKVIVNPVNFEERLLLTLYSTTNDILCVIHLFLVTVLDSDYSRQNTTGF